MYGDVMDGNLKSVMKKLYGPMVASDDKEGIDEVKRKGVYLLKEYANVLYEFVDMHDLKLLSLDLNTKKK